MPSLAEIAASAQAAHDAGRLDDAIALYRTAAETAPDDPTWPKRLAGLFREKGELRPRIDALLDAAEAHGRRKEPLKGIATAKLARALDKSYERAVQVLERLRRRQEATEEESGSFSLPDGRHALAVIPLIRKTRPPAQAGLTALSTGLPTPVEPKVDDLTLDAPPPIPLFSALSSEAYTSLTDRCTITRRGPGEVVFSRGEPSDAIFVVIEGAVEVRLEDTGPSVATLGEGQFFGEIGVLTGKPRGATIQAASGGAELMVIEFQLITELVHRHPDVVRTLLTFLRQRLADNVLERSPIFSDFSTSERMELRERFSLFDVDAGATLIPQGQVSPSLYVLIDGRLDVAHRDERGETKWIATLEPGEICGEISVITRLPAVAEVRADDRCLVLALPADGFYQLVQNHPSLLAEATRLAGARMEELAAIRHANGPKLVVLT